MNKFVAKVPHQNIYIDKDELRLTALLAHARIWSDREAAKKFATDNGITHHSVLEYVPFEVAVQDQIRGFIREYERNEHRTPAEHAAVAALRTLTFHTDRNPPDLVAATTRLMEVIGSFLGMCTRMKDEVVPDSAPGL